MPHSFAQETRTFELTGLPLWLEIVVGVKSIKAWLPSVASSFLRSVPFSDAEHAKDRFEQTGLL